MEHFFTLAKARTQQTGRLHIVVMRDHGVSVVSERIAFLANYTRVI
jgi:hypothetical protein